MKRYYKTFFMCAILLVLVGCSGGGGDNPPSNTNPDTITLTGTAAAGAPIVGIVNVKGANGLTASSAIEMDGTFTLDVSDLTPPYILFAEGSVNGKSIKIFSAAVAEGNINITPVTDFILRNALAIAPETVYSSGDTTVITSAALSTVENDAQTSLDPLLSALGVPPESDLLTTPFVADGTGIDAVLDALDISYSGSTATVVNQLTGSSFTDDTAVTGIATALPSSDEAATLEVLADGDAITVFWQALTDLYTTSPTSTDITGWFDNVADDFLEEGIDKSTMLNEWLLGEGPEVGASLTGRIIAPLDVSATSYTKGYIVEVHYTSATMSFNFSTTMVFASDQWYWYGDRTWVQFDADTHAYMGVDMGGATTFATGFELSMEDPINYAHDQGANSAVVTGPGLPASGVIFEHGFPEPEFIIYNQGGIFYAIPSDTLVTAIPDNAEYTFKLCADAAADLAGGAICTVLQTYTDTVSKPPVPVTQLSASMFANLTMPSSHDLADLNFGGMINVTWTKPANTISGEVGLAFDSTWLSAEPDVNDVSATLDATGLYPISGWAGLFIRVEDEWGRDFNMGWQFTGNAVFTELDGTWAGACEPLSTASIDGSFRWYDSYNGTDYEGFAELFDNPSCSGNPQVTKYFYGYIIVGNSFTTTNGITATRFDFFVTSTNSVPSGPSELSDALPGFSQGDQYYDIYSVQGDTLHYGDYSTGDASSTLTRPTEIDLTIGYVKQP